MSAFSIPVINLQTLDDDRTLRTLDSACRSLGAFQIVGQGLPTTQQLNVLMAMHAFFALSTGEKHALCRSQDNHWGYYDRELTKNRRDMKEVYDYGKPEGERLKPQWPTQLPTFKPAIEKYFAACESLALALVEAMARNLNADAAELKRAFLPHNSSFLRLNYYPVPPQDNENLGIHPHTDAGAVTLLLQDQQAGLEVFHDKAWHLVKPIDGALFVNLGDIAQVWSNDRYRAPLHRVIASKQRSRYSAAFFLNPHFNAVYQPLPSMVDVANQAFYRPIHWREFRDARAQGDYQDVGHEIQISDFRI